MKKLFVLIIVTLASGAFAQNTPVHAFGDGESLSYSVSYRAALIPSINVMYVTLHTIAEDLSGIPHYHVVGNGRTTSFAKGFFDINDTYHSWLDAATMRPSRMTSDVQEDNYRFKSTFNYDWQSMVVNTVRRNARWDADKFEFMSLNENSGDALSLFYRLRQTDVKRLVKGETYPLDLVLSETTKPIYYTFLGRENVKVRKLGTFRALKFTCTMATSDGSTYEEGMVFTVWISDDLNKIPLVIDTPIKVGRFGRRQ